MFYNSTTKNVAKQPKLNRELNTKNHVKIWFSKNPVEPFGGIINELRLIRHRINNPDHNIHLIVDKSLLSTVGLKKLDEFCNKHHIKIHDIEELKLGASDLEKNLLSNAKRELTEKNGSCAAASDLVRWIKSVINMGIYSDLDVEIRFKDMPPEITVNGFIFSISFMKNVLVCNNDFLAIPDANHKIVDVMQKRLFKNYKKADEILKNREDDQDDSRVETVLNNSGPQVLNDSLTELYGEFLEALNSRSIEGSVLKGKVLLGSDRAWLNEGIEELKILKDDMEKSARKIQSFWKKHKAKVDIEKTTTEIHKLSKK